MTYRLAINGFGRIGRNVLRALYESKKFHDIKVVAINDLSTIEANAYLLKYDSVHGRFNADVKIEGDCIVVNGDKITLCAQRDPQNLPWKDLQIDCVLECTGMFTSKEKATMHLKAGAKKVLISAPAGDDIKTIVFGVNQNTLNSSDVIVSNASCTTNCLAPVAQVLQENIGIEAGLMLTVHSYTNDQKLTDSAHSDLRRARAATLSMIPTKTGAAAAVGLVLPELKGKLDGYAVRVPTINVSMIDLTFEAKKKTSVAEVNAMMKQASKTSELKGILDYCDEPLVSIDFNHCSASSTFDATETRIIGNLVKIVSWYDNEWGFSNRMLDTAQRMVKL